MKSRKRLGTLPGGHVRLLCFNGLLTVTVSSIALAASGQAKQAPDTTKCVPQKLEVLRAKGSGDTGLRQGFLEPSGVSRQSQKFPSKVPTKSESANSLKDLRKLLEAAARRGDSRAQLNLGVASLAGWGAPPNAGAALYWFHAAADQGYPPAFYDLGIVYMQGCGVQQDHAQAFRFFEKGALSGEPSAQVNLGYLYDQGLGVKQDRAAAAVWYRKAAEVGAAVAQYNLADLYLRGEGVAQDDVAAFRWFQRAALQGHPRARVMLGSMYATGRGSSKDIAAAYMWLIASEMEGDPRCQVLLQSIEPQLSSEQLAEARSRAKSLGGAHTLSNETALLY